MREVARDRWGPWPAQVQPTVLLIPDRDGAACNQDCATTAGKHSPTASTSSNTSSTFTFNHRESTAIFVTKWSRTNGIWESIWSLLMEHLWRDPRILTTPTLPPWSHQAWLLNPWTPQFSLLLMLSPPLLQWQIDEDVRFKSSSYTVWGFLWIYNQPKIQT